MKKISLSLLFLLLIKVMEKVSETNPMSNCEADSSLDTLSLIDHEGIYILNWK